MNEKNENTKKKGIGKIIAVLLITLLLAGGAGIGGFFIWRSAGYLVLDNARVTTTYFAVMPSIPGTLERFNIHTGRYVSQNEIIGWVEGGEAMRSPFDGLVVASNARQGQTVSPMEQLALIADTGNIHIEAFIDETDVGRVTIGQIVTVTVDPLGNRQFEGYISNISAITSAELTGQAMFFNTGGNFTRVTHIFSVEVAIMDDVNLDNFIGANARVRIPLR